MWLVFSQVAGLGRKPMAQRYAIASLCRGARVPHASAPRAAADEAAEALRANAGDDAQRILGSIDATKLRSLMTLFIRADAAPPVFAAVLGAFSDGEADAATDRLL